MSDLKIQNNIGKTRSEWIDVMKGVGILLVVFGHFMESYNANPVVGSTFYCIYRFHMPLFCLCSGLVARLNIKKLITQQLWLYLLFQGLLLVFRSKVMLEDFSEIGGLIPALFLPWRHMWYLYALMLWELTIPLLQFLRDRLGFAGAAIGFVAATGIGLYAGNVVWPFALARVFSFYPFFVFGVLFMPQMKLLAERATEKLALKYISAAVLAVAYALTYAATYTDRIPRNISGALFHDVAYDGAYTMASRAVFYVIGIATCLLLVCLCTRGKLMAALGRNTLPVYLLHLPILAALIQYRAYEPLRDGPTVPVVAFVCVLSLGVTALLGNNYTAAAFNKLASVWYDLLFGKAKTAKQA